MGIIMAEVIRLRSMADFKTMDIVITLKVTKEFKLRMWIGAQLCSLACWIMKCSYSKSVRNGD